MDLVNILNNYGWMNAKDICLKMEIKPSEANRRVIRQLAEESNGRIISGQEGYKLTSKATNEEVHHACAWLRSQAAKMFVRAIQIENVNSTKQYSQSLF